MSGAEFAEWMAFDAIDPLPDRRGDWQHATLSAHLLNALTTRQDKRPWRPQDLLLFGRPEPQPHDRAAVARQALAVVQALRKRSRDVG
jgi:hypothetical protein